MAAARKPAPPTPPSRPLKNRPLTRPPTPRNSSTSPMSPTSAGAIHHHQTIRLLPPLPVDLYPESTQGGRFPFLRDWTGRTAPLMLAADVSGSSPVPARPAPVRADPQHRTVDRRADGRGDAAAAGGQRRHLRDDPADGGLQRPGRALAPGAPGRGGAAAVAGRRRDRPEGFSAHRPAGVSRSLQPRRPLGARTHRGAGAADPGRPPAGGP